MVKKMTVNKTTTKDNAVSPVIGVMLLLIITVIIAAVLSSYVGELSQTRTKAPTLMISPDIYLNDTSMFIDMPVNSAGDGIQTKNLKIITYWTTNSKTGGNTTTGISNEYPHGHGIGVKYTENGDHFGNYTLFGGTLMYINTTEGCDAFLGKDWNALHEGDLINIRIIDIPSQATVSDSDVIIRKVNGE